MLIVQISDTHVTPSGAKAYGIAPMNDNLALCIDHINKLAPKPDLVIVTGDITSNGLLQETRNAEALLAKLTAPYFVIPGNHDDRNHLCMVFAGSACPSEGNGFVNYVVEGHELRLIAMDTTQPGEAGGRICSARAAWLDEKLIAAPEQPTILFMHHPPLKFGVLETDEDGFEGADLLGEVVAKHHNIERILCGHIHLSAHARWFGTIVSTAPSMGMQLMLDLTLQLPSQFYLDAPAYQLHYWTPDKNLITHTIALGERKGPYLFEDNSR